MLIFVANLLLPTLVKMLCPWGVVILFSEPQNIGLSVLMQKEYDNGEDFNLPEYI